MEITEETPDTTSVGADLTVDVEPSDVLTFQFPQPTVPKVAVVGFAGGHHFQAPFNDEGVEIWGINRLWTTLPDRRWTRWFELHDLERFYRDDEEHKAFLKAFDGPVYVREQDYPLALDWGIENAQPFPHRLLIEQFGGYFTNTVSWLLGLTILMRFDWLGVYGVDMAVDNVMQNEYQEQRPSCEYFLGIAEGRGMTTFIPPGSDLLKATHLYGYEDTGPVLEKMGSRFQELGRAKEQIRNEMGGHHKQLETKQGQISQLDGAMQEIAYWRKNWLTPVEYEIEAP